MVHRPAGREEGKQGATYGHGWQRPEPTALPLSAPMAQTALTCLQLEKNQELPGASQCEPGQLCPTAQGSGITEPLLAAAG